MINTRYVSLRCIASIASVSSNLEQISGQIMSIVVVRCKLAQQKRIRLFFFIKYANKNSLRELLPIISDPPRGYLFNDLYMRVDYNT